MSPLLHLVRSESKTEVSSRPWFQNQISTDTFLSSHHNATICTSCLDTWQREHKSRNLYWQGWVCHAEESDVRGEMSVFMPKSDSHCISPIVILRNNNLWDVNTMKKNPCNRSCRCQSVWHERKKKTENNCEISIFTLNPISTDTILFSKCNIDQSIFCTTERTPDSILPARALTTTIANKCTPWKMQTISVCHCQNAGHKMTANKGARREISIVTPTWYFHWHFPAVKLQNIEHLAQTTSNRAHVTSTRSKSRMSEVRCLSPYRSQIPTLFILSPFFAIPKFEM